MLQYIVQTFLAMNTERASLKSTLQIEHQCHLHNIVCSLLVNYLNLGGFWGGGEEWKWEVFVVRFEDYYLNSFMFVLNIFCTP